MNDDYVELRPSSYLKRDRSKHSPTYSLSDFAENVKLPYSKILYRKSKSNNFPKNIHKSGKGSLQYKLSELMEWHKQFND